MEQQRIWDLLGKKMAAEASAEELEELENGLAHHPELLASKQLIENYWNAPDEKTEFEERENALEKHMLRMRLEKAFDDPTADNADSRRLTVILKRSAIAAALIGLLCITAFLFFEFKTGDPAFKTLYASNGSKNHFILPDGSKVWLNAGTSLKYPLSLKKDSIREVFLSGEAFFEIRHDDTHPFWIRTKQMDIMDIGTVFNVKAYPSDKTAEATLVEGSIKVKMNNINRSEILSVPNEKITVFSRHEGADHPGAQRTASIANSATVVKAPAYRISKVVPQSADSLVAETAWMKDKLVFNNQNFQELATLMERWYDVTIKFENNALTRYRFTGVFADETIEQALDQIKLMRAFDYSVTEGKVTITEINR